MATRSITTVQTKKSNGEYHVCADIYRHFDGYLEVQGVELLKFLEGVKFPVGGADRIAAMLIAFMEGKGAEPCLATSKVMGQEFHYVISLDYNMNSPISVAVYTGPATAFGMGGDKCNVCVFSGLVEEYREFLKKEMSQQNL